MHISAIQMYPKPENRRRRLIEALAALVAPYEAQLSWGECKLQPDIELKLSVVRKCSSIIYKSEHYFIYQIPRICLTSYMHGIK